LTSNKALLLSIVAHARSGALDHAWRLFREAGLEAVGDDPAVLTVRGRLLKDSALAATGEARRAAYEAAAQAYATAGALDGAAYPLINAATLSLLAERPDEAARRAGLVLEHLLAHPDEAETPYYRIATRAEALLLLGRTDEARAALAAAMEAAPRAWEDHASTLRQFGLILRAQGDDDAWLHALRPPRALHFAGHLGVGAGDLDAARAVADVLDAERVGFGYGALAAGADMIIAEALLAHGAELHLVLPGGPEAFRRASVEAVGPGWGERFDRLLARADSVLTVAARVEGADAPAAVALAAEVAMGLAAMQAQRLATEAVQLLVLDNGEGAEGSAAFGLRWREAGRRQRQLIVGRTPGDAPLAASHADVGDRLVASLSVEVAELDAGRIETVILPTLARAAAEADAAEPSRWSGSTLSLTFPTPAQAAAAGLSIIAALGEGVRIGGDYGVARQIADPFAPGFLLLGETTRTPKVLAAAAPPGVLLVSECFAAALQAFPGEPVRAEGVGELSGADPDQPIRLFSLRR
jgi:hypothetical protein